MSQNSFLDNKKNHERFFHMLGGGTNTQSKIYHRSSLYKNHKVCTAIFTKQTGCTSTTAKREVEQTILRKVYLSYRHTIVIRITFQTSNFQMRQHLMNLDYWQVSKISGNILEIFGNLQKLHCNSYNPMEYIQNSVKKTYFSEMRPPPVPQL